MGLCNARESHASHPECVLIPNEGAGKIHLSMSAQRFYYLLEMCLPLFKCSTASRVEMLPTGPGYAPWQPPPLPSAVLSSEGTEHAQH